MTHRSSFESTRPRGLRRRFVAATLVVAVLAAGSASFAQDDAAGGEPRWYGGAHVLLSNANIGAPRDYDPRLGLGAGVYVGASVWKAFDLRTGLDMVQKGANLSVGDWSVEWQMDYLEVPLLVVYNFAPRSRTSFEIVGGVAYGFGVHQQVEEGDNLGYDLEEMKGLAIPLEQIYFDVNGQPTPRTALIIDDVKTTDLSAVLGFGLSAPVGAVNLCFDVRYEVGLTDPAVQSRFQQVVGDASESGFATIDNDFKNKAYCFFVGFEFPFGSRTGSE